jgi:hypothetical protein
MAKPNAVNYVGSSTAKISFNYTDSSKTDISTIITNIQLTTDTNAFSVTPSSQQLLTQLKQVNQNVRINSLTVDPSTAVWDKTHVIVGDETHSGSYKVTVSVKPNDLIYTGTVDVYYLIKRSQLNFTQTSFILPSVSSSRVVNEIQRIDVLIIILDNNEIDVDSILQNYSFT